MTQKNSETFVDESYTFQDKSSVYLFTNENIAGYLEQSGDISGANILTVGASGDHAFESYLMGAKHVDTFDINSWQANVIELKTHMIRNLDYCDFMDFFFEKENFFDKKIIKPIESLFSDELTKFVNLYTGESKMMFKYLGACAPDFQPYRIKYIQCEQNYEKLRDKLPEKIDFRHCNVTHIANHMDKEYKLVMLSNIFEYMYRCLTTTDRRVNVFYDEILHHMLQHITPDGRIYFHYAWGGAARSWNYLLDFTQKRFNTQNNMAAIEVPSAFKRNSTDAVLYAYKNQHMK